MVDEKAATMSTMTASFKGTSVFLSRSLVPPETFDALHDALKTNGARVFLCCDPSRSAPNDYHVISSLDHEKFDDLRAKGCNLLGPQCIFSCAKERRLLPKQGYTCCLAMDGVKVLASGFEKDEKVRIEKLVTAMGGVLVTKASLDVSFVIVKNVLAAKYKWASNVLKKPIVTSLWLSQCWKEHRLVPQESYRILPFTGLTICATRFPADVRKEMERLIIQNGGQYSADLTKKCTHLVSDAPEGDKYKVARKWGHIHIVNKKWVDQSIARKACLDEEFYPVRGASISLSNAVKGGAKDQHSQDKSNTTLQSVSLTVNADQETTVSQNISSTFSDATVFTKEDGGLPSLYARDETKVDGCVAEDSQTEDTDLYLSDCRVLLVGFQPAEMRRLVSMVRKGGGSRHMLFSEKLTHIIVGTPSEIEWKEVRRLSAWGVINVVRTVWLEDCDREKKEVIVSRRHTVSDLLLPKDSLCSNKAAVGIKQGESFIPFSSKATDQVSTETTFEAGFSLDKSREERPASTLEATNSVHAAAKSDRKDQSCVVDVQDYTSSNVFKGHLFCFSSYFPQDRRAEIVEWVIQGGGLIVDDQGMQNVHFIIERHGLIRKPASGSQSTIVSSHWIRCCIEEGSMPDVGSHILYSPLPCRVPLPGFEAFRFCISQYEEKERQLLRNLCFVLGAKFTEKLSKKVTHLLCKFASGPKYEAANKWGIESVTAEWLTECIRQDTMVDLDTFRPKAVTALDREAGLCTVSQYPTQAAHMVSGDVSSQLPSKSHGPTSIPAQTIAIRSNHSGEGPKHLRSFSKRAKHSKDETHGGLLPAEVPVHEDVLACNVHSARKNLPEDLREGSHAVPDVASVIEDLLAETNKIQDMESLRTGCDQGIFAPDHSILDQDRTESRSSFAVSKQWLNRIERSENINNPSGCYENQGTCNGFSETQTESQVVLYEEDLSGRQMLIDRVRSQSMI